MSNRLDMISGKMKKNKSFADTVVLVVRLKIYATWNNGHISASNGVDIDDGIESFVIQKGRASR